MSAITYSMDEQRAQQPGVVNHSIDLEFTRGLEKVTVGSRLLPAVSDDADDVQEVHMFVSYKADESYTPSTISVRIGNTLFDLNVGKISLPGYEQQAFVCRKSRDWLYISQKGG